MISVAARELRSRAASLIRVCSSTLFVRRLEWNSKHGTQALLSWRAVVDRCQHGPLPLWAFLLSAGGGRWRVWRLLGARCLDRRVKLRVGPEGLWYAPW